MKLKREWYGHVTVILAANIILISVRYMINKICKNYSVLRYSFRKSHNLCELTTYFMDINGVMSLTPSFNFI